MLFQSLLALGAALLMVSCGGGPDTRPTQGDASDSALPTATLQAANLPADLWERALQDMQARGMQVDQIALMVDGRVLATHHGTGHSDTTLHDLRSATKSVTSLLVGIAIDRGLIGGLDAPIDLFFPDYVNPLRLSAHRAITVRDLLSMRSGLDCDDGRDASAGNEERMYPRADWIRFFYDIPAVEAPGSRFSYCTAGVVMLGEIVARAAGQPLPAFAQEALFEPLGIRNAVWATGPRAVTDAGGHLRLSLASMLKLGELMRRGGIWQDSRVVSQTWVSHSVRSTGLIAPEQGFVAHMGLLWWLEPVVDGVARSFQARGNGGQLVIVVPEFKLVVAVTGHAYNQSAAVQFAPFVLLQRWFIPALRGQAVPADPV